ncbi:MAG: acetyl-CoA carboxylase biotin carboxylase subunit [Thermoprotei archaeon]|nr:MAG: acetyl-CoA carboxylase biotin carboxylase subunit [Thermoprotei archaeon]
MSEIGFKKILVANRNEIAVRIIRTLKELGITSVAIYSDADEDALHVRLADEKYYLGPPEPAHSYLDIDRIVEIAVEAGVDAVHPGYGFLSQNPMFAEKLEEKGIIFIGPPPSVQRLVGDKLGARRFFHSHGVPVVPGTFKPVSIKDAESIAEEIGFPVMVKPVAGGGGIGMFIAHNVQELRDRIERARKLASKAFGSIEVYIERYFPRAKHIEVQILGDKYGNIVHLFERECSVQRRFQKVIEESPSPSITEEERERLLGYGVLAAKSSGYVNAGTFEFLFDVNERKFYLLEVNSRIQVEHPVTEMITGIDIVEEQIRIADGKELSFKQEEVSRRGHAIEARLYAEDPVNNFIPSPGKIKVLREPSGPWIRVDSGVYSGYVVPEHYDPLLMKVISWGSTRIQAIRRLRRALNELIVSGVKTNKFLLLRILEHKEFIEGKYTTRFLDDKREIYTDLKSEDIVEEREERKEPEKAPRREGVANAWRAAARLGIGGG